MYTLSIKNFYYTIIVVKYVNGKTYDLSSSFLQVSVSPYIFDAIPYSYERLLENTKRCINKKKFKDVKIFVDCYIKSTVFGLTKISLTSYTMVEFERKLHDIIEREACHE